MTSTEIREMISFLRDEGALQVEVGGVKAVFADVRSKDRSVQAEFEGPDAQHFSVPTALEAHIQKRFGVSAEELLGG